MTHLLKTIAYNFRIDYDLLEKFALEPANYKKFGIDYDGYNYNTTTWYSNDLIEAFKTTQISKK